MAFIVRVKLRSAVGPSSNVFVFMSSFLHVLFFGARWNARLAVCTLWILVAQLVVVESLPIDLLWIGLLTGSGCLLVGLKEPLTARYLNVRYRINNDELLNIWGVGETWGILGRVLSFSDEAGSNFHFHRFQLPHKIFFVENFPQVPLAKSNLGWGIIDLKAARRHA